MKRSYTKPAIARVGILSKVTAIASKPSDRRLKTNVARVGTTVFGLPHYRFSYLGSPETFVGVMAQDVLKVMPQAVSCDPAGFYRVNYDMLGIEMTRAA